MGERQEQPFPPSFNRFSRVALQGSRVPSDGGPIVVRELDERLGFGGRIEGHLLDSRANKARLPFANLLWQSVYSRQVRGLNRSGVRLLGTESSRSSIGRGIERLR